MAGAYGVVAGVDEADRGEEELQILRERQAEEETDELGPVLLEPMVEQGGLVGVGDRRGQKAPAHAASGLMFDWGRAAPPGAEPGRGCVQGESLSGRAAGGRATDLAARGTECELARVNTRVTQ